MKKNNKIVRYPRTLNINIGVIFFALIFIYLLFNVYVYMTEKHVSYYEVDEGSIRIQTSYTGLALRQEQLVYAAQSGYVNYYLKDNSRARSGSLICSVDESGNIADQISSAGGSGNTLDNDAYGALVDDMKDYSNSYGDMAYYNTYTFKSDLQAELMEAVNLSALDSMSEYAANAEADNTFHRINASVPGIVSYYCDGYESVTTENFTEGMLDASGYEKDNCKSATKVEAGDPLYKLITSEDWQLLFAVSDDVKELLKDESVLKVRFKSDETTAWANLEFLDRNGKTYLLLNFNNSMIRYASERFVDVELLLSNQEGLKIPNRSIVTKNFYVIPIKYFSQGGAGNSVGVLVETTDDEGEKIDKFVATDIYYSTEECYYVSEDELTGGTRLIDPSNPNGSDYFTIGDNEDLKGVYNINKGYAVFRIIDILYQNDEYAIVARGTSYGLSQYDHIALDGSIITEDEMI
jgi:hypothetical protein